MEPIKSKIKLRVPIEWAFWGEKKCLILKRDWSNAKLGEVPETEKCAFCGAKHLHGGKDGHRIAHCPHPPHITCIAEDGTILNSKDGIILVDLNKR